MIFTETPLDGAYVIEQELITDNRGFFSRTFCAAEFQKNGLEAEFVQFNNSFSSSKGTLRGLHYQLDPFSEVKVVRCVRGALWDVVVDLRIGSRTYGSWYGTELSADNRKMMYVPQGFAHGFLTLSCNTEALYFVSNYYNPECESGLRYDDPFININWPMEPVVVSEKDLRWPGFVT